jgi:hypothetical protein
MESLDSLDREIADAEDLVARQTRLVHRLSQGGQSAPHAERLLVTLTDAVGRLRARREVIEKRKDRPQG